MGKALGKVFSKKNFFAECLAAALGKVFFLKKIQKFFAECLNRSTRQKNYLKKNKKPLPSAWAGALGKVFFKKIIFFCRVLGRALGKITVNGWRRNGRKYFAECRPKHLAIFFYFAECPDKKHSAKTLCREKIYRADFAECYTRQSLCRVQRALCRV